VPEGFRRYHESEVRFTWNVTLQELEQIALLLDYYVVAKEVKFRYATDQVLANRWVVRLEEMQEAMRGTYRPFLPND